MECTFARLADVVTVSNVSDYYKVYFKQKPIFKYNGANEKIEVIGNNTQIVYGGKVAISIYFEYEGNGDSGNGWAESYINDVAFSKRIGIVNNQDYYNYLVSFENIHVENFSFVNCNPPLRELQYATFKKIFNDNPGNKAVKEELESSLNQNKRA